MGYTLYHTIKNTDPELLINEFYRGILKRLKVEGGNLLSLFLNEQNDFTEKFNAHFHEYAVDTDPKGSPCIDMSQDFGFTKTARKKYDVAVLLTYLFDDRLTAGGIKTSGDYDEDTQKIIHDIFVLFGTHDMFPYIMNYIQAELSPDEFSVDEIKDVVHFIVEFCNTEEMLLLKENIQEEWDEEQQEKKDEQREEDIEEIGEQVKRGFTSGITGNGNSRELKL